MIGAVKKENYASSAKIKTLAWANILMNSLPGVFRPVIWNIYKIIIIYKIYLILHGHILKQYKIGISRWMPQTKVVSYIV